MLRTILKLGLAIGAPFAAFCQPAPPPAFDAASVKPVKVDADLKGPGPGSVSFTPGGVAMNGVSLRTVILTAYGVRDYQLSGPTWMDTERYDILAKADAAVATGQIKLMLQGLPADRFQLTLHRESKELALYFLGVGKSQPKLANAKSPGEPGMRISGGSMVFQNYSMEKLADFLSQRSDHPVMNNTELGGSFDFSVQFGDGESGSPADVKRALGQARTDGSLARIVAEQLGLRLESRRGPVEVLVVDHAERPSAN